MAKPVYHGTYEEYHALPQNIRQYYRPPPKPVPVEEYPAEVRKYYEPKTVELTPKEFESRYNVELDIPEEAIITKVARTREGAYQIEYVPSAPPPIPPPRPPPKDTVQWLQRGWEGVVGGYRETLYPTTRERVKRMVGFQAELPTTQLIRKTEQAQAWLREAPIKRQLMFDPYTGKPEFKKPVVEEAAKALEYAYIPIGVARAVEVPIAIAPSLYQAVTKGKVTPGTIEKGLREWWTGIQKQPVTLITTFTPEQIAKHRGLVVGELVGSYLMGKYVYGPAIGKAWGKVKGGARVLYRKTPLYERALYKKVTTPLPVAKELVPEEQAFKVLTKTKVGWQYKPLRITETAKKPTWKPTLWKKPVGFKPTPAKWYPPAPMKATVLRELPRVIPSGKGMALIAKQVTKQMPKVTLKQVVSPLFAKPIVKATLLASLAVPSLVKPRMKPFPSIYKQKKEIFAVSIPKLGPYPTEKPKKKEKVAPISLLKTWELESLGQPQIPKLGEIQLPKEAQILRQPQLGKQVQKQWEQQVQALKVMQVQIQKQVPMRQYRFRLEEVFGKRKRGRLEEEKWWFRRHPIPTPRSVLELFAVKPRKRKRKKRKRR